jgi:hypothetical protein
VSKRLMPDPDYAGRAEEALMEVLAGALLEDVSPGEDGEEEYTAAEVNVVETFTESGFGGKGLVLYLSDGAEIRMTITAGVPQEGAR